MEINTKYFFLLLCNYYFPNFWCSILCHSVITFHSWIPTPSPHPKLFILQSSVLVNDTTSYSCQKPKPIFISSFHLTLNVTYCTVMTIPSFHHPYCLYSSTLWPRSLHNLECSSVLLFLSPSRDSLLWLFWWSPWHGCYSQGLPGDLEWGGGMSPILLRAQWQWAVSSVGCSTALHSLATTATAGCVPGVPGWHGPKQSAVPSAQGSTLPGFSMSRVPWHHLRSCDLPCPLRRTLSLRPLAFPSMLVGR